MNQPHRERRDVVLQCILGAALAVAMLLVYCRAFDHNFVNFDDNDYVAQNGWVQGGLTPAGVRYAFTALDCGNWHPLTWLSLQLDAHLYGGANAPGFHITSVALHVLNALLLFFLLETLTGLMWRSAGVAALF